MTELSQLSTFFVALISVISTTYGYGWQPGGAICGCFNSVYIDKPKTIAECSPKTKFLNQIFQNYNNVNFALLLNGPPNGCDFAKYRERVNVIKERILQMVEAYFACVDADCTAAIMRAYNKYVDNVTFDFNPYSRCSYSNFNRDCAQILIQNRHPLYASAENILTTLLTCAKYKSEQHFVTVQSLSSPSLLHQEKDAECNCIKIDPRPIPKDECECFSGKYIFTLRTFVEVNFGTVVGEFNTNINSTCEYAPLIGYVEQLRQLSLAIIKLLEKASPQYAELDEYFKQFSDLVPIYNQAVRSYILNNEKPCYFIARKVRHYPIAITDAVLAALTKCVGYKVLGDDRCSIFLK